MSEIKLRFNAGVEYKGKIYASAIHINGLFQLNLSTHEIVYLKAFSEEEPCYATHRTAFLYKNEAWFVPQNGRYIAIVNLDSLEIQYIAPPFRRKNENAVSRVNAVYYSGNIIREKYLYLVPANIDALLLIDLENKILYPYYDVSSMEDYFLFGAYAKESIFLCPFSGKHLLELNLRLNTRKNYAWTYPPESFLDVVCCKGKLWFCPYTSDSTISYDLDSKRIEEIPLNDFFDSQNTFEQIQVYNDKLLFMPLKGNKVLKLDTDNKKLSQEYLPQDLLENGENGFTKIYSKDNIIMASFKKGMLLFYDKERDEFQRIELRIERDTLIHEIEHSQTGLKFEEVVCEELYLANGFCKEVFWGIEKCMESENASEGLKKNSYKNYGKLIWEMSQ